MVEVLLSAGADVNKINRLARTPLFEAARNGRVEVVERLLSAGAHVKTPGHVNRTLLHRPVLARYTEVVRLLLAAGADANKAFRKHTPLLWAVFYGRTEMVELLLAAGADINKADRYGCTPLKLSRYGFIRIRFPVVSQMVRQWDSHSVRTPVALKQLCSIAIRQSLIPRPNLLYNAHKLPLPRLLISYLMLGGITTTTRDALARDDDDDDDEYDSEADVFEYSSDSDDEVDDWGECEVACGRAMVVPWS